jgi:multiple antibiotic resistance protein
VGNFASWTEYTRFLIALVAVLDPFFAIPVYLGLTANCNDVERRRVAGTTTLTVLAVLVCSALVGETMLELIGASLASLAIGGGLVLLLLALAMLSAQAGNIRQTPQEANELENRESAGVVPLAIPLLAGPGAISTVILAAEQPGGGLHRAAIVACIAVVCCGLWLVLRLAAAIGRALGATGLNVISRLLGLVLAAIAIESIATGLKQMFPVLAGG